MKRSLKSPLFLILFALMSFNPLPSFSQDRAGQTVVKIGIDRDNDATTGCDFDPGTGVLQAGVDVVLEITVNTETNPATVVGTTVLTCNGQSFDGGFTLGGAHCRV